MDQIMVYRDVTSARTEKVELIIDGKSLSLAVAGLRVDGSPVVSHARADFDEWRNRPEADGFDRWVYPLEDGDLTTPFNVHAITAGEKVPPFMHATRINKLLFAHVIVRPEDESFEDCVYMIQGSPGMEFHCNRPAGFPQREITWGRHAYWPQMALAAPEETRGPCAVEVRMHQRASCDLYPKCDAGHVPRKIRVENGRGTFVFTPIGMQTGEASEIKVGFAHFTNIASTRIVKASSLRDSLWRSFTLSGRR